MKLNIIPIILLSCISAASFSQNVGIDVPEPLGKLHINLNSSVPNPHLRLTEDDDDYARIKMESNENPLAFWDIAGKADTVTENSLLNFYFKNAYNSGDRLTIRGNGNIGINNTNPESKLDIRNIGNGSELLRLTTERPWVFKQSSSGVWSRLTLKSTVGDKIFEIVSPDESKVTAAFRAHEISPQAYLVPVEGRLGIGTYTPSSRATIIGSPTENETILKVESTYSGNEHIIGMECRAYPEVGYGVGANFYGGHRGLRGLSDGESSYGTSIGVVGAAYGSSNNGTRIGVHGAAFGGFINWAGYFKDGNVYVTNELRIGDGAKQGAYGYKVAIDGKLIAEEVRVQSSNAWPDYVFEDEYQLTPLTELEKTIKNQGHLPGVPSAKEVEEGGIILGEMQNILLKKIEELTLYTIDLQKQVEALNTELKTIKANK